MRKSRLPDGGTNKFGEIKEIKGVASKKGLAIWNLGIGEPEDVPALASARMVAAQVVLSEKSSVHGYSDNGSGGVLDYAQYNRGDKDFKKLVEADFGKRFAVANVPALADALDENVAYLPIPGIKPMLGLVTLACGSYLDPNKPIKIRVMEGYPTPYDWATVYLHQDAKLIGWDHTKGFLPSLDEIPEDTELLKLNVPHNPSGTVATREWFDELCAYCEKHDIRIFNDAAYIMLSHNLDSCSLAEVAIHYPDLEWVEAYSCSKTIGNGCGWRVGSMAGTPEFIADIAKIKGNTDSGFVAAMAAGVLNSVENDMVSIIANRVMYFDRLTWLSQVLRESGMELAVNPAATFFSLWLTPKEAFGKRIDSAKDFNYLMFEKTGIIGVQFEPYMRYAVCSDIMQSDYQDAIMTGFYEAKVKY